MAPLNLNLQDCPYQALIGTGGIGSGIFFALDGDHTLGREESRSGRFLDQRDYCKLHIIAHYVKVLLGPAFETILVGKVGGRQDGAADDWGRRLLEEMRSAGLDTRYVGVCPGEQTMLSVCFLYPDGTGGNLTTSDSACNRVDESYIASVEPEFVRLTGRGVVLAAPEVPLEARRLLLQLGRKYRFFNAASFTSAEMVPAVQMKLLALTDLLSINQDEAASLLGRAAESSSPEVVVEPAILRLSEINPAMRIAITAGKAGSWGWDGACLTHAPAQLVPVASSAGAGDAFLAALIVGTVAGLSWSQSQELASLVSALSVTSPHTIHPGLERTALLTFASQLGVNLSDSVWTLLRPL
jgi:sugar/nucleoside kinase (ribokinase family)